MTIDATLTAGSVQETVTVEGNPLEVQFNNSNVTLTIDNLPPHTHALFASAAAGLANDPGNAMLSAPFSGDNLYASPSGRTLVPLQVLQSNSGGGQPHNNMQPSLALTFMICVEGIWPQPQEF